jgi:hypothetical protein
MACKKSIERLKKRLNFKNKLSLLFKLYKYFNSRKISNYFKTKYSKNALLSYITYPFVKEQNLSHTNYFEAISHAKILNELGFNVDIIDYDYDRNVDFSKYRVLVGFGEQFTNYFNSGFTHMKTIYYGTGMHVCHQNNATLKRLKQVYQKKGIWLTKSTRYVEKTWTYQTMLVDAIIALGNDICKESYAKYYNGPIFIIPAPFYKVLDGYEILSKKTKNSAKGFLWFGGAGLIHKGLDLVLEYFIEHPELTLHICGPIKNEPDFEKLYYKELYQTPNIITHGFIDISSEHFKQILEECAFIIFASCSEGGGPSVITAIGNGALIPIITKETTISTNFEVWIEDFTVEEIEKAVNKALSFSEDAIIEMQKANLEYVLENHSQTNYYKELKKAYIGILGYKDDL